VKNVQISFDEDLLTLVDKLANSEQLSRSAAVREAVRNWIRQKEIDKFERAWKARLVQVRRDEQRYDEEERQSEREEAEAWLRAEGWDDG